MTARLHHEDVGTAHVLQDLKIDLPVAEFAKRRPSRPRAQVTADGFRQRRIRGAAEDLELIVDQDLPSDAAASALRAAVFFPRKGLADENLIVREPVSSSARLRWASEDSKHRRTATRQRGFRCSSLEQTPLQPG